MGGGGGGEAPGSGCGFIYFSIATTVPNFETLPTLLL